MRVQIPEWLDQIATQVVDAAFKVHYRLGPGLLESVYETCLQHEIRKRGLRVQRQVCLPVQYDGLCLNPGLRLDLWVERALIIEVKAVDFVLPVHEAQVLTYLKLTGNHLRFLMNFNVKLIRDGMKRLIL